MKDSSSTSFANEFIRAIKPLLAFLNGQERRTKIEDLVGVHAAANRRYLEFVSQLDGPTAAMRNLEKIAATVVENGRTYKGFNFFDHGDIRLFEALVRGETTSSAGCDQSCSVKTTRRDKHAGR
jgi:hypothetical protein